ncbi:unnamed protein product [Chrysoparadoxa australica]
MRLLFHLVSAALLWAPGLCWVTTTMVSGVRPISKEIQRSQPPRSSGSKRPVLARVVLVAGFESFNLQLYKDVARDLEGLCPELQLDVFTDREIKEQPKVVEAALASADVFFGSLLFDYDQVQFLQERIEQIPIRLVFESALELMSFTKIGDFDMSGGSSGPPAPVKALLSKFSSGKEEDRLAGYLKLLKVGPSLLKFVPGKKAGDLRSWLEIYSYWNQGGAENVMSMMLTLGDRYLLPAGVAPPPSQLIETPSQALVHPASNVYFKDPKEYLTWYDKERDRLGLAPKGSPLVALLLYRKHVVTSQRYISQLINILEGQGLQPVPIFINGVEGHTILRDWLTSEYEQNKRREGVVGCPSQIKDPACVSAVINTIGFPLVGGPAGSMEAGRRIDVATELLGTKNIPYVVAAPLLIQDLTGWRRDGVQGLQQVVLYSLPELDAAIDTVVLGGLVGDTIALVPERVRKLASRLRSWITLQQTATADRKVAFLVYGFPPGVGAVGTAALLNVPESLELMLKEMVKLGYDLGPDAGVDGENISGEAIVAALKVLSQDSVIAKGYDRLQDSVDHAASLGEECSYRIADPKGLAGAKVVGRGLRPMDLDQYLSKRMTKKVEKGWGDLSRYRGVATSGKGDLVVSGLQLGNLFLGVQPLIGVEGDPMRLMFERDLTPTPQYCAFYKWVQNDFGAQAAIHFGMHGTVEWLPGSPLGNTYETWPDQLMGEMPNVYIYAANNPSESILAKRRGYGLLVSHNIPPYARAGLYKELANLKGVLSEYREDPETNASLRPIIVEQLENVGMYDDKPFKGGSIRAESVEAMTGDELEELNSYLAEVQDYLYVLEERLFSEGLHVLGALPSKENIKQYLSAYYQKDMPEEVADLIAGMGAESSLKECVQEVKRLGGRYEHITVLTDGLTDIMTADMTPDKVTGANGFLEEQYEETLDGVEWLQWKWLMLLRHFGVDGASNDIKGRLEAMKEIGLESSSRYNTHVLYLTFTPSHSLDGEVMTPERALSKQVAEAHTITRLLQKNTDERTSVLRALNGEYIPPGVGGDLLRDGPGVLPTGRNMHALDPYRMPSPAAWIRGQEAARVILEKHVVDTAEYPETLALCGSHLSVVSQHSLPYARSFQVAVTLWGLDAIKTRGESVAIVLALVGARPVKEATGRVVKYELIPLSELGRPRVDVLASLSGIFRDSFANVLDLLDDLFAAASAADEPLDMNYIRKHTLELEEKGVERANSRLFSNPSGDFGSLVNERVGSGDWDKGESLGSTWQDRNVFSYGKGKERGAARPEVFQSLLESTDRIIQEIDSVEYGLTDIQEYYANLGAMKKAAEMAKGKAAPGKKKKKVGVSVVEAFGKEVKPKELEDTLRMEYRTKLLNPKWAEAMVSQGSGGGYEISQRLTALIGWSGTADFQDEWVYDGAAQRYALDEEMAAKLRKSNPEAFQNILKRMLEAHGRGFWSPSDDVLEKIRDQYGDIEDQIELGSGKFL